MYAPHNIIGVNKSAMHRETQDVDKPCRIIAHIDVHITRAGMLLFTTQYVPIFSQRHRAQGPCALCVSWWQGIKPISIDRHEWITVAPGCREWCGRFNAGGVLISRADT
eukprot:COSAG02_NODE_117_length_35386_cov_78.819163_4_plen_109_part_00